MRCDLFKSCDSNCTRELTNCVYLAMLQAQVTYSAEVREPVESRDVLMADISSQEDAIELDELQAYMKDPKVTLHDKVTRVSRALDQLREDRKARIEEAMKETVAVLENIAEDVMRHCGEVASVSLDIQQARIDQIMAVLREIARNDDKCALHKSSLQRVYNQVVSKVV
ncbi:hypothetical protein SARC_12235 [Sphaeroforma arctica JP610]|uniref:Uncharacterized protein n=1 Tax=Sphaeroforma arctica JP610 TaxID=667725 RepID=A0A0L0FEP5_9EUKA|nr:hypothetical protein SARC_12235 [Sphaeroforma arctica JP610]KNC75237.1 hypothetical protein SARC_12235 [Sphaeroforma arctica JP610]|eukprot:XP_014149139.1 hypothetical protein SARC_12235 [Sphaeroforma arctica JP610]